MSYFVLGLPKSSMYPTWEGARLSALGVGWVKISYTCGFGPRLRPCWMTVLSILRRLHSKKRILFLCTGNSARSQMAEGLLRHMAGDRFDVVSAGTHPGGVHPFSVHVMREIGIDISNYTSKVIDTFINQHFDMVITVCDRAKETCPIFPSTSSTLHWSFDDPAAAGSLDERERVFRRVRDEIAGRIRLFIKEEGLADSRRSEP